MPRSPARRFKPESCALVAFAHGPMDWTVGAAILALTQLALEDGTAERLHALFQELADRIPRQGYCCYAHALVSCWLLLPDLDLTAGVRLEEWRAGLESQ